MKFPIYFDYQATTPLDPRIKDEMLPYFCEHFGNPASLSHEFGWRAKAAVDKARKQVAALIEAEPSEITFTSGASESNNTVIFGLSDLSKSLVGKHFVVNAIEHKSVLNCFKELERRGAQVTYLQVNVEGDLDLKHIKKAITPQTVLVSVMAANNEIGTIYPIQEIARLCHERNIFFHTDAAQAVSYLPVSVKKWDVDFLSMSAHKIYGPKGIGALYIRKKDPKIALTPLIFGGGQEKGLRSGTLNVPGIVGFGKACELALHEREQEAKRLKSLRDFLYHNLSKIKGFKINGGMEKRLPHNLNFAFEGVFGSVLSTALKTLAFSGGSACGSSSTEPSYVLKSIGCTDEIAGNSVRLSLGRMTTDEEIQYAWKEFEKTIEDVRRSQS